MADNQKNDVNFDGELLNENISLDEDIALEENTSLDKDIALEENPSLDKDIALEENTPLDKDISLEEDTSLDKDISLEEDTSLDKDISLEENSSLDKDIALETPVIPKKNDEPLNTTQSKETSNSKINSKIKRLKNIPSNLKDTTLSPKMDKNLTYISATFTFIALIIILIIIFKVIL